MKLFCYVYQNIYRHYQGQIFSINRFYQNILHYLTLYILHVLIFIILWYRTTFKEWTNLVKIFILTAVTFFLMPAVSFSSFLISTDIILVLFWTLSLLQLLIIKESPNIFNFILLGIFVGIAFLAKYAAVYFIFCLMLLFLEKEMRYIFLKYKLYFFYFVLTVGLIIFPNLIWNIKNSWWNRYACSQHTRKWK